MSRVRILETPTGQFFLLALDDGTIESGWVEMAEAMGRMSGEGLEEALRDDSILADVAARVLQAFAGQRVDFSDLPTPSGTPFQRAVWRAPRAIPFGETRTYGQIAATVGSTGAARAVGQAMRKNRLPMVIPCHRVVGVTGIGGFGGDDRAGGWNSMKSALLQAEQEETHLCIETTTVRDSTSTFYGA